MSSTRDRYQVQQDLCDALDDITGPGDFAALRTIKDDDFTQPNIHVSKVGNINLPLREVQARQLIDQARQAPFGKGLQTVVDVSVRRTWELDPSQFQFGNPQWDGYVKRLCSYVAKDLGISERLPVRAELYKMLIYEPGAMFKPHTDTEKIPGMFGSMVISLPSPHTGGEVVVRHCGKKMVLKTYKCPQSFACWYSDVSHEVLPVISGYRWVLTYNLAIDPNHVRPTAVEAIPGMAELRSAIRHWLFSKDKRQPDHWFYGLEHEYTQANVSLKALKGSDLARVQCLKELSTLGFDVFLTLFEKEVTGNCEVDPDQFDNIYHDSEEEEEEDVEPSFHGIEDELECDYRSKRIVDLDGHKVASGMGFSDPEFLRDDFFDGVTGKEIGYERYMGNSGPTATHLYRSSAVVIVRRDALADFFLSSSKRNLPSLVSYLVESVGRQGYDSDAMRTLKSIFLEYATGDDPELSEDDALEILQLVVQFHDWWFFDEINRQTQPLLPSEFFEWAGEWLVEDPRLIVTLGSRLSLAIQNLPSLHQQLTEIQAVLGELGESDTPETLRWARAAIDGCLAAADNLTLCEVDAIELMSNLDIYDLEYVHRSIVPVVKRKASDVGFALEFLDQVYRYYPKVTLPVWPEAPKIWHEIAASIIEKFDVARVQKRASINGLDDTYLRLSSLAWKLIASKHNTTSGPLSEAFTSKITTQAAKIPVARFDDVWLPFLRKLLSLLNLNKISIATPQFQGLYRAVLNAYLVNYVGREPDSDGGLKMRSLRCGCSDCNKVSQFLRGNSRSDEFHLTRSRRAHVHEEIKYARIDCRHETRRPTDWLVITKNGNDQHGNWLTRANKAQNEIKRFDQAHLKLLLGAEYPAIRNLRGFRRGDPPRKPLATLPRSSGPQPLGGVSGNASSSGTSSTHISQAGSTGIKRKAAEVIDLTPDSSPVSKARLQ